MGLFSAIGGGLLGGLSPFGGPVGTGVGAALGAKGDLDLGFNSDGTKAKNLLTDNPGIQAMLEEAKATNNPQLMNAIQNYASGKGDLQSVLSSSSNPGAAARALATDPLGGSKLATDQVMSNPLFAGTYGAGGMQSRMLDQEKDLSSRGFQMQPEDEEAYGRASDNEARLASQQEGSLAQALASRGLAAGGSGAAAVSFSGIQGNKFEKLAAAQRQIADDRVKTNQARLESVRNSILQTNQQGETALNNQYNRNTNGAATQRAVNTDAANAGINLQNQENQGFKQESDTKGPGLSQILGTAAGMGAGAYLNGPAGAAAGGTLGSALGKGIK